MFGLLKNLSKLVILSGIALMSFNYFISHPVYAANSTGKCKKTSFLGLPSWYQYLNVEERSLNSDTSSETVCVIVKDPGGTPIEGLDDLGKVLPNVVVAILDLLLRLAGLVAFIFIVLSGFRFVFAQGDPGREKKAREALISAVIGMLIAMLATFIISFIGRRLLI